MTAYKDYGFYDNNATHNFNYQLTPLLRLLNLEQNRNVIDLGCGNGYLVNYLIKLGYNAYGTDASEKGIDIANKTNQNRFFIQDLSSDKFPKKLQQIPFDTIIATEVIEHLYDPESFIDFCRRNLQPGGELIISTPYHGYIKNLALSLFDKWDSHMNPIWVGGHIKLWSKKTLNKLLIDKGFTILNFSGCGRVPYLWKSMIIKARLP